jgi:hypothetical protein
MGLNVKIKHAVIHASKIIAGITKVASINFIL